MGGEGTACVWRGLWATTGLTTFQTTAVQPLPGSKLKTFSVNFVFTGVLSCIATPVPSSFHWPKCWFSSSPRWSGFVALLKHRTSSFVEHALGEGNDNPLQYSCLENPMGTGACRLQSMGSRRVGHDWATSLSLFTFMHWRRKLEPTPVFLPGESQGWWSLVGCHL